MKTMISFILLSFLFLSVVTASPLVWAHQGHKHPGPESTTPMIRHDFDSATKEAKRDYQLRVEPIFKKSCMDCHSGQTLFPWYYKIPGIKQMLDSDISEARHHLDMSAGYPFKSHATPLEDFDAIAESIQKGTMPPFFYRIMHSEAVMTEDEKKTVLNWIEKSRLLLEK